MEGNMYDNYVFDLYGTLVDIHTEENDAKVWEKLSLFYGFYGALYDPQELQESYLALIQSKETDLKGELEKEPHYAHEAFPEIRIEEVFKELYAKKGIKAEDALAVHTGQFFRVLTMEYVRIYDGVRELLKALKKCGKKVYLLSNAQRIFTEYEMNYLDITKYFDDILISSDYGTKKPDIRFFEQLIEKYHLDVKKTLMIGNDVRCDINGAKEAGLDTFYIHSNISPKDDQKPDSTYYLPAMDMKKVKELILQNASGTHGV